MFHALFQFNLTSVNVFFLRIQRPIGNLIDVKMVKIGEDEKVSFTVVWKGRTELQVNEIIPKLTDYARSLEEFEQNEFEHLVIVHSPPKDDYDQQADFVPDQMIDAMSSKETQVSYNLVRF